jgi:hypothetical protein
LIPKINNQARGPRDGAIIFRDLVGKLGVLTVECDKCGRFGERLIEHYGIDAKLFDCIERQAPRRPISCCDNVPPHLISHIQPSSSLPQPNER